MQKNSDGFRLFGITVRIDSSWLIIFLIVTVDLSVLVLPRLHPNWEVGLQWLVGIVASLLFFASVLLHELTHSLVARARGIPVSEITLFMFGGVSNIEKQPDSPKTEFLMAAVGPFTSIILGGILVFFANQALDGMDAAATIRDSIARLGPIPTLLLWLGPINIILGTFNLLPGYPLDGGRILRSGLWAITNNFEKATFYAALVGQVVAWGLIAVGASMILGVQVPILGTGLFNGVWLIVLGWFLLSAARRSSE